MRCLAVLSALLLGACATQPLPFAIERGGTLPADRYPALDRLAANAKPVTYVPWVTPLPGKPEPYWAYAFDPGLNLASLPLQVGAFTGTTAKGGEVAAALPGRTVDALRDAHLFASVGTEPAPGALVLTGTVVRASTEGTYDGSTAAMTQVEARLTRNGAVVGVMQVNALQLEGNFSSPLAALISSAAQGSRATYIGTKFREIFEGVAAGRAEGIDTDTVSKRFIMAR